MRLWRHGERGAVRFLASALEHSIDSPQTAEQVVNEMHALTVRAQDIQRRLGAIGRKLPSDIFRFDDKAKLSASIMSPDAPWLRTPVERIATPSMITSEEAQYFTYIGSFYQGQGRAVELGPWLGASTQHIVLSLAKNPRFAGERLHVFDDFVWRKDWMDQYVPMADQLPRHACFRDLFDRHTATVQHLLDIKRVKISDYDGNERLPSFEWNGDPIEILYVDCGRTMEVNQAWYNRVLGALIPGRTLIVMQDWRLHREVPRKWFNQTLLFTESKGDDLMLLHEVSDGGLATFLFTGHRADIS